MRGILVGAVLVALAFGVGVTGAPGRVFSAAADWASDAGHLRLKGPVGDAVREAL